LFGEVISPSPGCALSVNRSRLLDYDKPLLSRTVSQLGRFNPLGVVIPFEGSGEKQPSLDPLVALSAGDMVKVNEAILARAASHVELIPELAGHLINSGGKRIRPMLTIASARMCGAKGEAYIKLATSVE